MSLYQQIQADLITAQKAKDQERVDALRLMVNDIKNQAINNAGDRNNVSDEDVIKALTKAVKQRKDSIQIFSENNRQDLADKEQKELDVIQSYMPQMMTLEEVEKQLIPLVAAAGDNKNFGMLMKQSMDLLRGKADATDIKNTLEKLIKG